MGAKRRAGPGERPGGGRSHPSTRRDVNAWLDGFMPYALRSEDIAGAVVVVVKDGKVLTEKGWVAGPT